MPLSVLTAANSLIYGGSASSIRAIYSVPTQQQTNSIQISGKYDTYTVSRYRGTVLEFTSPPQTASTFVDSTTANSGYTPVPPVLLVNTLYSYLITPTYNGVVKKSAYPKRGSGGGKVCTLASPSGLTLTYYGAGSSISSASFTSQGRNNTYYSIAVQDSCGNLLSTTQNYPNSTFNSSVFNGNALSVNTLYTFTVYVLNSEGVGRNISSCLATVQTCTLASINTPTFSNIGYYSLNITATGSYTSAKISIDSPVGTESPASGSNIVYSVLSSATGASFTGLNVNVASPGIKFTLAPVNLLNYPSNTNASTGYQVLTTVATTTPTITNRTIVTGDGLRSIKVTDISGIYTGFYVSVTSANGLTLYYSNPDLLTGNTCIVQNDSIPDNTNCYLKLYPVIGTGANMVKNTYFGNVVYTLPNPTLSTFTINAATTTSTNKSYLSILTFIGGYDVRNGFGYITGLLRGTSIKTSFTGANPNLIISLNTGTMGPNRPCTVDFYVDGSASTDVGNVNCLITTLTAYSPPTQGVIFLSNIGVSSFKLDISGTYSRSYSTAMITYTRSTGNEKYISGTIFSCTDISNGVFFEGMNPYVYLGGVTSVYLTTYNEDGIPYYTTSTATAPTLPVQVVIFSTSSNTFDAINSSYRIYDTSGVYQLGLIVLVLNSGNNIKFVKNCTHLIINRYLGTNTTGTLQSSETIYPKDLYFDLSSGYYFNTDVSKEYTSYYYTISPCYTDPYNGITTTARLCSFGAGTSADATKLDPKNTNDNTNVTTTSVSFSWTYNKYGNVSITNTTTSVSAGAFANTILNYNSSGIETLTVNTVYRYSLAAKPGITSITFDTCTQASINAPTFGNVTVSSVKITATGSYTSAIVNITTPTGNETPASGSTVLYSELSVGKVFSGLSPGGNITFTLIPVNILGNYNTSSGVTGTQQLTALSVTTAVFSISRNAQTIDISNITGTFNYYNVKRGGVIIASDQTSSFFSDSDTIKSSNTSYTYTITPGFIINQTKTIGTDFSPTIPSGITGTAGTFCTLATNPTTLSPVYNATYTNTGTVAFNWTNTNYFSISIRNNTLPGTVTNYLSSANTVLYKSTESNKLLADTYYDYGLYTLNANGVGLDISACQITYTACTWGSMTTPTTMNKGISSITLVVSGKYTNGYVTFTYTTPATATGYESPASGSNILYNDLSNGAVFTNLYPGSTITFTVSSVNQASNRATTTFTTGAVTLTAPAITSAAFDTLTTSDKISISGITGNTTQFIVNRYLGASATGGNTQSPVQTGVSTYLDTGLSPNTQYTYTITPCYTVGSTVYNGTTIFKTITMPSGTTGTAGTIYTLPSISGIKPVFNNGGSSTSVSFTFTQGTSGTSSYLIIQNTTLNGSTFTTKVNATGFSSGSITTDTLVPNTQYIYTLIPLNAQSIPNDSTTITTYTWASITSITFSNITSTEFTVDVVGSYEKLYYTYTPTTGSPGSGTTSTGKTFSQKFTGIALSTTYTFSFYPININNFQSTTATTGSKLMIPSTPAAPTLTVVGNVITVKWTSVATATTYTVTNVEGLLVTQTGVTGASTTFTYSTLTSYSFTVTAVNATGSSNTSPASLSISPPPATPNAPSVYFSGTTIGVSWDSVATTTSYKVINVEGKLATKTGITGTSTTFTGITVDSASYSFTVTAINSTGTSNASNSTAVTASYNSVVAQSYGPIVLLDFLDKSLTNHGSQSISITYTNYTPVYVVGKTAYCLQFPFVNTYSGTSNNITKSYISFSVSNLGPPYTIAMWLYLNDAHTSTANTNNNWMEFYQSGANDKASVYGEYNASHLTFANARSYMPLLNSEFLTGSWVHVALIIKSSTTTTTYYNGVLVENTTINNSLNQLSDSAATMNFNLGWAPRLGAFFGNPGFSGNIGQFVIYNSELSASQISKLYSTAY